MKLKFKLQSYQSAAVDNVVDCFEGQPYAVDQRAIGDKKSDLNFGTLASPDEGTQNAEIVIDDSQLLNNIQRVQRRQGLSVSPSETDFSVLDSQGRRVPAGATYIRDLVAATNVHLDVEMETGTGKTYCYIKTIFELNKRYGWSKFIIIVPSIAIREGVFKALDITSEHFHETYLKQAKYFIYNSRQLHELEAFSSNPGINVMVINIQAFNAKGADNRRIYDESEDFRSRRPIDVIARNRAIVIMDEPQKMEGPATLKALSRFNPLAILRYSATHRTKHLLVHRLDALDAYQQKLVKKIEVLGIQPHGLKSLGYLYLDTIDVSTELPMAKVEMEVRLRSGKIKREMRRLKFRDDLYAKSSGLEQYKGFIVSQIDSRTNSVEFSNGVTARCGEAIGDSIEDEIQRIQIRETIKAHLDKEQKLHAIGVKVLSLFFIDEVKKYRDYDQTDKKGEYARIFEQEYNSILQQFLSESPRLDTKYSQYLSTIEVQETHKGYFSIDKRTNQLRNPKIKLRTGESDDVDAYELILRDKERLLSFDEPTRFIFSHSALREGWDNPNVFVICPLKRSDNRISRRQEVGRGLRLCVNQEGNRLDEENVHENNVLTVVASESYQNFVAGLQAEIVDSLESRPQKANWNYFFGKSITVNGRSVQITEPLTDQILFYMIANMYVNIDYGITKQYCEERESGNLADLPDLLKPFAKQIFELIDAVFTKISLPVPANRRWQQTNPLNSNFEKHEFQEIWKRINRKAVFRVDFKTEELIKHCVSALDKELQVPALYYSIRRGKQKQDVSDFQFEQGTGFDAGRTSISRSVVEAPAVKYDLIGRVCKLTNLLRKTVATILVKMQPSVFAQVRHNPERFISEVSRIINEQRASTVIEHLGYDEIEERYDVEIFTANQHGQDMSCATERLSKHIFDFAITDSKVERDFVTDLDGSDEVVLYAKLPSGFTIPTPMGQYTPDWAISFKEGSVKHIFFVAETKGSMSSLQMRTVESAKIECARKFFDEVSRRVSEQRVKYDVVSSYGKLIKIVGEPT